MKKGGGRAPKEKPCVRGWPPPVLVNGVVARVVLSVGLLDLSKLTGGQLRKLSHFAVARSYALGHFCDSLSLL